MQNYKDVNGKVHFLDSTVFEYLLSASCVRITQAEADAISNPPLSLAEAKAVKLKAINAQCTDLLAQVTACVPADEIQSWSKQEAEARAYTASNEAPTPLLSAIATARGMPSMCWRPRLLKRLIYSHLLPVK